jgi:NADH dehydrogenase
MILIVGATGVLGREVARQLLAAGHKVRAMTRAPDKAEDLKQLGAEVVQGDLIDPASLGRACHEADGVLAAAHALMGTGKYSSEPVDDVGHRALLDAAKAAGVKQFVYASARGVFPEHPVDFFRTKAKIEQHVIASGLNYTILRPSAFMEWHVHNLLGKSILESGKTTVFGNGNNPINFVAASDVARFVVIALGDHKIGGKTLEIGGPSNVTKRQLAEMYATFSGRPVKVRYVPTRVMRVMSPLVRPLVPVLSRLMAMSVWSDTTDQTFDPSALLGEYPMRLTPVGDFIRERVAEAMQATPR